MGAIYHEGDPYSRQMVVDTALSAVSNNPLKNRAITGLVDDVIAPVEGANASQAYSAGDELILNNLLYKANQAITQGTAFDPESGGNLDLAGSIVEQLKSLFDGETILKNTLGTTTLSNLDISSSDLGVRYYVYGSGIKTSGNAPNDNWGYLIHINNGSTYAFQIAIENNGNSIFIRKKATTWGAWKQIYDGSSHTITLASTVTYVGHYLGGSISTHFIPIDIPTIDDTVTANITGAYIYIDGSWKEITYDSLRTTSGRCEILCKNKTGVTPTDGRAYYYYFTGSLSYTHN